MSDQEKNGTESAEHGHHEHGHHEHGHHEHGHHEHGHHEHGSHEHGSHGCWHHGEGHHPRGKHCGREGDWWSERALSQKILIGIGFGILGLVFISFIGWVTMTLWNRLMPQIFGWGRIGYWQAWGLLILSCIFFKNFGGSGDSRRSEKKRKKELRRHMRETHEIHKDSEPQHES